MDNETHLNKPMHARARTILFVCTEDWFFHSHFRPLVEAARQASDDVRIVLATNVGDKSETLERLGIEVIPCDFARGSLHPLSVWRDVRRLRGIIRRLRPDFVHFIALQPILTAVLGRLPVRSAVFHITGLGTLAENSSARIRLLREILFRLLARHVRHRERALVFENPDDVRYLQDHGLPADADVTILGGAGIDPEKFPPLPDPGDGAIRAAFVGRLIATKGVDVLIEAMGRPVLRQSGVELDIYGDVDSGNAGAFSREEIMAWADTPHVHWHGYTNDIPGVWKRAAICVVPTRTREGMPRAMLEAAACARPLVVTDVPGCRHFVRDGVEGFIVPPEDPQALAGAILKLAENRELRERMGRAARARLLEGFTEDRVIAEVGYIYRKLLPD